MWLMPASSALENLATIQAEHVQRMSGMVDRIEASAPTGQRQLWAVRRRPKRLDLHAFRDCQGIFQVHA